MLRRLSHLTGGGGIRLNHYIAGCPPSKTGPPTNNNRVFFLTVGLLKPHHRREEASSSLHNYGSRSPCLCFSVLHTQLREARFLGEIFMCDEAVPTTQVSFKERPQMKFGAPAPIGNHLLRRGTSSGSGPRSLMEGLPLLLLGSRSINVARGISA